MNSSYFIKLIVALSILSGGLGVASANASPPSSLNSTSLTWALHSSGVRSYNFIDVYQCALYFPANEKPNQEKLTASAKDLKSPVAIRIEISTSMLPDKMPDVWRETIESEVTGKAFLHFRKGFARLDEGDVLLFLYLPGEGTRLLLNDKPVFKDPGPGLMQSLLEQWVGSNPISEDLKQALIKK